jgi:hypothetical protein
MPDAPSAKLVRASFAARKPCIHRCAFGTSCVWARVRSVRKASHRPPCIEPSLAGGVPSIAMQKPRLCVLVSPWSPRNASVRRHLAFTRTPSRRRNLCLPGVFNVVVHRRSWLDSGPRRRAFWGERGMNRRSITSIGRCGAVLLLAHTPLTTQSQTRNRQGRNLRVWELQ